IDMGASWINGVDDNPVMRLATESKIKTIEDEDTWLLYTHDGRKISDEDARAVRKTVAEIEDELAALGEAVDEDISIQAAVEKLLAGQKLSAEERRFVGLYLAGLETDVGGDAQKLSLQYTRDDDGFHGDSHLLPGGYVQVAEKLAQGLDIRTGMKV